MSLTLDISSDFVDLADNPEAAKVVLRRPEGSTEIAIANSLESMTKQDRAIIDGLSVNGGQYQMRCIPDEQLNANGEGYRIVADDEILLTDRPEVVLVVLSSEPRGMGVSVSYWACVCRERRV